ncbi:MAG TPA: hypothetical protein V6C78_09140 [Crinalium sp.]|jgi:hypothetical protein
MRGNSLLHASASFAVSGSVAIVPLITLMAVFASFFEMHLQWVGISDPTKPVRFQRLPG